LIDDEKFIKKGGIYLNNKEIKTKNNLLMENREGPISKIIEIEFDTKEQLKLGGADYGKFKIIDKSKTMEVSHQHDLYNQNIRKLQEINEELKTERNKSNQYLSDLKNIQNRQSKELNEIYKKAKKETLINLLKVIDELERAQKNIHHIQNINDLRGIVQYNVKIVSDLLKKEKVEPMNAKGKPFNPKYHQAEQIVKSHIYEEKIILEEMVKGYLFNGEILRAAVVKVAVPENKN